MFVTAQLLSSMIKRKQTVPDLMIITGAMLIVCAIPVAFVFAFLGQPSVRPDAHWEIISGCAMAATVGITGSALLCIGEIIVKQRLKGDNAMFRKIARTGTAFSPAIGYLFLSILWVRALFTAPHADVWNTVVLEYLAISLGLLILSFIPFCFLTRFNGARSLQIYANIGCWLLIIPLMVSSILYGVHLRNIWGTFTDGNDYFDPLVFILNYLTPLGCFGVSGLFILWRHGFTRGRSIALATVLFAILTMALCVFGVLFFYGQEPPFRLSYFVWWFVPFRLLGM